MKKYFIILLAFLCLNGFTQKLEKKFIGNYKYTQLPEKTDLKGASKYYVIGISPYEDPYRRDALVQNINLIGFEKGLEKNTADFIVRVEEYPLKIESSERIDETKVSKKDGVEIKTVYYYYKSKYTFKYVFKITKAGSVIYTTEESGNGVISGSQKTSSSNAHKSYNEKVKELRASIIKNKVSIINERVNDIYCFPVKSINTRGVKVKSKKFNYDEFNKASDMIKEALLLSKENENDIEGLSAILNTAIPIYENTLKESDVENRKARVNKNVTAACYYNLGCIYLILKNYDKSLENLEKAQEFDKNVTASHGPMIVLMKSRKERAIININ